MACNVTIGYPALDPEKFNDDRFTRALDRLYLAERASLMTEFVTKVVREFRLELARIHNDSTTLKAYGSYPGTTRSGLEMKQGHSKDHRPDLKQLVFSLSISADGAVPVHHKVYSGNRTALTLTKSDPVMLKIIDPPAARMFTEMGERPKRFVVV